MTIKRGDVIKFKPKHMHPEDENMIFVAVDDSSKGRVTVMVLTDWPINPTQVVWVDWIESTTR